MWLAIAFATIGTSFAGVLLQNEVVVDDADPETAWRSPIAMAM